MRVDDVEQPAIGREKHAVVAGRGQRGVAHLHHRRDPAHILRVDDADVPVAVRVAAAERAGIATRVDDRVFDAGGAQHGDALIDHVALGDPVQRHRHAGPAEGGAGRIQRKLSVVHEAIAHGDRCAFARVEARRAAQGLEVVKFRQHRGVERAPGEPGNQVRLAQDRVQVRRDERKASVAVEP